MSGEIDIYHMAMNAEADLRDSRMERARLRREGNVPSTFHRYEGTPLQALLAWTSAQAGSLVHGNRSFGRTADDGRPAPIAPGDAVS